MDGMDGVVALPHGSARAPPPDGSISSYGGGGACRDPYRAELATKHLRHLFTKLDVGGNDIFVSFGIAPGALVAHGWNPTTMTIRPQDAVQKMLILHNRGALAEDPTLCFGNVSGCGTPICHLTLDVLEAINPIRCIMMATLSPSAGVVAMRSMGHLSTGSFLSRRSRNLPFFV